MATFNTQTSLGKIEDSIECSVCTHRFREPKWLNCFHTFCLQCLQIQDTLKNRGSQCKKLLCPLCRKETILTNGNVSDLLDNSEMKALVEAFTQQEKVTKQKFEQLDSFPELVAKARRSNLEFELSVESLDESLKKLDKVFRDTKKKISKKATKEVSRIRDEEQKLKKKATKIHKIKMEVLKSLQASDRREATQTAHTLDEVNRLMSGGSNGSKGQDLKKKICKDLEKATMKHPQSVPDGLTFMDFKENDVTSLGKLVQSDADLTLLNQWTRQKHIKKTNSVMKYTYREDQWSPLNPDGKRVYDRDFLLQFQGNYYKKPEGLPYIPDIILDNPNGRLPKAAVMAYPTQSQASVPVYPVMDRKPVHMLSKPSPRKVKPSNNRPQQIPAKIQTDVLKNYKFNCRRSANYYMQADYEEVYSDGEEEYCETLYNQEDQMESQKKLHLTLGDWFSH